MTNSTISQIDLDFATFKQSLKTHLKGRPEFKDYDFEASNINVLLDIMAINAYKNAFYYNMAIGEGFLDSAQLRPNIVSRAKELNYTPRSAKSSKAQVTVNFEASGASAPYIIQKGASFTALVKNQAFTFTTAENIVCTSANNSYSFTTNIHEGLYLQDVYFVQDSDEEFPKYRITNDNVDTASLTVAVYEDGAETPVNYQLTDTLLGLNENSEVYFLQAIQGGYEILFGDNFFGKKPKIGARIVLDYRIASGSIADGSAVFNIDFDPTGSDELLSSPEVITVENSADGLEIQEADSIRLYAPRYFATQQRAVSSDDYASLILAKFPGTIDDVSVYGGETVEPKRYGRVIIALKPTTGTIVPDFIKEEVSSYLEKFVSLPTRIIMADADVYNIYVESTVDYDITITSKTSTEIKGIVQNAMLEFSGDNLEKFGLDFRYSQFIKAIDDSDGSIVSNDTTVKIVKKITPKTFAENTYTIEFGNQLHEGIPGYTENPVVTSTQFSWIDSNGIVYDFAQIRDDGSGNLVIYTIVNDQDVVLKDDLGTVNYTTGSIIINKLNVTDYSNSISIRATPLKKDIIMSQNKLVLIEASDLVVTAKIKTQ